jgi:hypothetical protein
MSCLRWIFVGHADLDGEHPNEDRSSSHESTKRDSSKPHVGSSGTPRSDRILWDAKRPSAT